MSTSRLKMNTFSSTARQRILLAATCVPLAMISPHNFPWPKSIIASQG